MWVSISGLHIPSKVSLALTVKGKSRLHFLSHIHFGIVLFCGHIHFWVVFIFVVIFISWAIFIFVVIFISGVVFIFGVWEHVLPCSEIHFETN